MASDIIVYHNPRCSKSRQTLELIRERGIEPTVVEYLKEVPSASKIKELIRLLGIEPHALVRSQEAPYGKHQLTAASTADQVAEAISADPILLERPVVIRGKRAIIGRPPEKVLELLK